MSLAVHELAFETVLCRLIHNRPICDESSNSSSRILKDISSDNKPPVTWVISCPNLKDK